jgi:hypothetical protein
MTQTISVASAGRRDRGFMDNPSGLPTTPQPHQHQPGRTFDPSVKADIFTRHGQVLGARQLSRFRDASNVRNVLPLF